jgi:hypothetical protein
MKKKPASELAPGYRNYLMVSFEGDRPSMRFDSWMPDPE